MKGADRCVCGAEPAIEYEDGFSDDEIKLEIQRARVEESKDIDDADAVKRLEKMGAELRSRLNEIRRLGRWLEQSSYEERAAKFEEALESGNDLLDLRNLRVATWPNHLETFKQETQERLKYAKQTAQRKSGNRGLLVFQRLQAHFKIKLHAARPRIDLESRIALARPVIEEHLDSVADVVRRMWREERDDGDVSEIPEALVRFASRFLEVSAPSARKTFGQAWRRSSLKPKALAVALLCQKAKKVSGLEGLREADVNRIVTPLWRPAYYGHGS